jgi:hypothetical protein
MEIEAIRDVSRQLFGNRYMLEVAAVIGTTTEGAEQVVYSRQISKQIDGPADNQVLQAVHKLAAAGILMPITEKADTRSTRYSVASSLFWDFSQRMLAELMAREGV